MSKISLILLWIISTNLAAQEWEFQWPSRLSPETPYYRGQQTDLASFDHIMDMLLNPETENVITSRMYRTLQNIFPELKTSDLIKLSNQQYEYWKQEKMIWWIADCHADPYMCNLPPIEKLMGVVFKKNHLPLPILNKLKGENDPAFSNSDSDSNPISKGELLAFFDPIVSTSYHKEIAESFGRDKNGYDGYVLILNDKFNRNCSIKNKESADCFIHNEEFMEELEFPMWGYVTAKELDGLIVDDLKIYKSALNKIKIIYSNNKEMTLELQNPKSCLKIRNIHAITPKLQRLIQSLEKYFQCSDFIIKQ